MPSGRRRPQPDPPVFFLDRGLGRRRVADAIRARGYQALPMADVYPNGADQRIGDPEWIRRADREGWVALTKDASIVRDHRAVLAQTTLRVFAFNNANVTGSELVSRLNTSFERIIRRSAVPGPYVWVIGRNSLEQRWP